VDEQEFAASIGDFVSLALEASERRRAEQAFRSAQEELLRQDFQARRQIEFELERVKDELMRQTRLATIGQIAASIAHELRKPLTAIRHAADSLRVHVPGEPARWAEEMRVVEEEIRRADVAISDLLALSQPKDPTKETVDLEPLVRDAFASFQCGEGLRLQLDFDPLPYVVEADPVLLRQVLTGLLLNSIEAMGLRGEIRVVARREAGFDVVRVKDDGPGIPEALRSRVFEPLVTTKVKGTGLGLPICRQVVERHGGTIEVVAGPGRGAEIRLRLPSRARG
jgi:signal transduction histidine kinase